MLWDRMQPFSSLRSNSRVLLKLSQHLIRKKEFPANGLLPLTPWVSITEASREGCRLNWQNTRSLPYGGHLPQPPRKCESLTSCFHGLRLPPSGGSATSPCEPANFPRFGLGTTVIRSIQSSSLHLRSFTTSPTS